MTSAAPDLIGAEPTLRVDVPALKQALAFAFAAGAPHEVFDEVVARAGVPATTFRADDFVRDLYVTELAEKCLVVTLDGKPQRAAGRYVAHVLAAPPRSAADRETRRAVLAELEKSPGARRELEGIYRTILKLRALLCAPRQPAPRVRRVEILRAAREAFEAMATSFEGCTSAVSRLRAFGGAVTSGEGHRRLVAFLEHDDHVAALSLRVRVGADGEVRALQIVGVEENRANPFHVSPWSRFVARLLLFFRGFRTTRGEVAERLLLEVFAGVEDAVASLFQVLGDAELFLGALAFRDRARAMGLPVTLADVGLPGDALSLDGLWNPLLAAAGSAPTPCSVRAGPNAIVVVTGPNSGGKTRLLQALGMVQLLAQAGLFVPARAAIVPSASGLFASLFEEPKSDAPEGHLGMELLRIRRLFEDLDEGALVVLDELCSGTNPSEGEEIARLVLSLLPELGVRAFVTTHFLQFAESLARDGTPGLEFLQVELDANERSTYQFVPGVARTSLAHKTAARLGVTREELLGRIAAKRGARPPVKS